MRTIFPLFGLGIKVLGLTAITVILFSSNVIVGSAQQGEAQEESEGDLQVVLNGEVFTTGDTITISGSVDDPDDQPILNIEVVDPESSVVARASPPITADDTFTFSFEAGGRDPFMLGDRPMTVSGNYRVTVTYLPSFTNIDEVDLEFEYIVTPAPEEQSEDTGGGEEGGVLEGIFGGVQDEEQGSSTTGGAATGIIPQQGALPSLPATMFESNVDGIRIGVPDGWVVEDLNNTDTGLLQGEQSYGAGVLVELCPQNQATPQIGGTYLCPDTQEGLDSVSVWRFADLKSRPEFAGLVQRNQSITTTDLVAFYFMYLEQKANFTNFRLLQNIDTTVNVIDPQTSQTIASAPAKYIETTYLDASGTTNEGDIALLVLGNDGNTGYALLPVASVLPAAGQLPAEHQMVFDSFELVAANSTAATTTTNATTISASPPSPFQQQLQQQQERQQQAPLPQLPQSQQQQRLQSNPDVSIVSGSSSLTDDAYEPNPVQIRLGDTITWTNDDSQPHTATSGENSAPDGRFDSGIMAPAATFEHTFTEAGEYRYFCLLHPNMVGTVSVS